jgi:hypothetical protein
VKPYEPALLCCPEILFISVSGTHSNRDRVKSWAMVQLEGTGEFKNISMMSSEFKHASFRINISF